MRMPPTTTCERSDLVLVRFILADEQGAKRRPVLVLSGPEYHAGRQEVIVAAVTSNVSRLLPGDHLIASWRRAGLPAASVITGIVRTIKRAMIERAIGRLPASDLRSFQRLLRATLGL
jgi:mRNA-degrading endonuclease toxin of MazEF toxin-antitoxin module